MKTINDASLIGVSTKSKRRSKRGGPVVDKKKDGRIPVKPAEISVLVNSFFWSLSLVFILHIKQCFRLIAIHEKSVYCDNFYPTEAEAREAFLPLFENRAWQPGIEPSWTPSYPPDDDWLEHKFKILAKHREVIGEWFQVPPPISLPWGARGINEKNQITAVRIRTPGDPYQENDKIKPLKDTSNKW